MTMEKKISKHIIFNEIHADIISDLINQVPGINSFSEAVRYSVLSMAGRSHEQKETAQLKKKQNAMSKDISILVEMVAGGFNGLGVNAIGSSEETYIYRDAEKIVEKTIQRATTVKSENKNKKYMSRNFY